MLELERLEKRIGWHLASVLRLGCHLATTKCTHVSSRKRHACTFRHQNRPSSGDANGVVWRRPWNGLASEGGWRGSPDVWLAAAYDALMESGIDGVKILPLAKRLNLSRTSFYWFFTDREALLSALVARWRDKNTGSIVARAEAYAETMAEAMLNVFDCWLDSEPLRFALRVRHPQLGDAVGQPSSPRCARPTASASRR